MSDRVAIVGTFQSSYEMEKRGQHLTELVYEVTSGLLNETGMDIKDVDNIVSCSQDFLDGRTISNRTIPEVEGAYLKSESKLAGDGAQAVFYGMMRILSGRYRTCLVLAHCKMSEGSQNVIANGMFDPFYSRSLGLDEVNAAAMQARRYMHCHGVTAEQCASAAARSLTQASRNDKVFRGRKTDAGHVLESRILSSPIHELEAYVPADGACALMLASGEYAANLTDKPVWIDGAATALDSYYLGDRDLAESPALSKAAKKAYTMAGVKDPGKEIDLFEVSSYFSYQDLLYPEALGLCGPGEGSKFIESKKSFFSGKISYNPSGGILGGNPLCVSGMTRVIEAARQIRREAGGHQVERRVDTALAHGSYGPCGQSQCVLLLRRK